MAPRLATPTKGIGRVPAVMVGVLLGLLFLNAAIGTARGDYAQGVFAVVLGGFVLRRRFRAPKGSTRETRRFYAAARVFIPAPVSTVSSHACDLLRQMSKDEPEIVDEPGRRVISATTPSRRNWGERLSVTISRRIGGSEVLLESTLARPQVTDWGINPRNVERMERRLRELSQPSPRLPST